jgi:hypothetical protein
MIYGTMKRYAAWPVLLMLLFAVASGGCSASDFYDESDYLPDARQFNGTWRASGHPDISINNFTFTDGGWGAQMDVIIGDSDLGRLAFGDLDGSGQTYFHWISTEYPREYMSVRMYGGYSSCEVSAYFDLENATIEITNVVYSK